MSIPEIIFIVPYRDRESHYNVFLNHMSYILADLNNYEILFIQPLDNKPFNRGATKNIGFLIAKEKYPEHYKDITFVFNDIDTMPGKKNMWDFKTTNGIIKHFYGFTYALGGILSITGGDFEKMNGFPNFWGWGYEDNCLQTRALKLGFKIDRSIFYKFGEKDVLQFFHSFERNIDKNIQMKIKNDTNNKGLNNISNLKYKENNIFGKFNMVNVLNWDIPEKHNTIEFIVYNQLEKKIKTNTNTNAMKMLFNRV
jgi:hypothetical protein